MQVSGVVRALDETLVAPLSGLACVGFRARAKGATMQASRTVTTGWLETMLLVPFVVESDAGPIAIDGANAIFDVTGQSKPKRQPDREASFLARHAIKPGRAWLDEVVVEVGRRVTVGGTLVLVPRTVPPTFERGFRDLPPSDQRLAGSRERPLVIRSR